MLTPFPPLCLLLMLPRSYLEDRWALAREQDTRQTQERRRRKRQHHDHPKSKAISISHTARNSIYFIHLSVQRFNVAYMDQATYMKLLGKDDIAIPQSQNTPITSGLPTALSGIHTLNKNCVGRKAAKDPIHRPDQNSNQALYTKRQYLDDQAALRAI